MTIPPFVIGIAEGGGAGKTTVAQLVTENVGEPVTRVLTDSYYRDQSHPDMAERGRVNYDHPFAFEWDLLCEQPSGLMEGRVVEMPQYDFEIHNRKSERETVKPTDVIILERTLALCGGGVNEIPNLRLYVETDADVRILRRIQHGAIDRGHGPQEVIDQYLSMVKPMHEQFVEPTRKHTDLTIPEGTNSIVVTLLEEKVQAEVKGDKTRAWERDAIKREVQGRASSHGSRN